MLLSHLRYVRWFVFANDKTQFVSDMRDPVETNSVLPVIHEEIAQTHDQPKALPEVICGNVLVNVDFECEDIPPVLCFPMGQVGEQLSTWSLSLFLFSALPADF